MVRTERTEPTLTDADKRARQLLEERLTHSVIGSFFDVHRELGFGYREDLYALALERDLVAKGHQVGRVVAVMVNFGGAPLARQTLDIIVDDKLREPKLFRMICENRLKHRQANGSCDR